MTTDGLLVHGPLYDLSKHTKKVNITKSQRCPGLSTPPSRLTMPRRRSPAVPIHMQIAQIDHSLYPPRPQPDDAMSITSNQMDDNDPRKSPEEIVLEDEDEATRPEDFS